MINALRTSVTALNSRVFRIKVWLMGRGVGLWGLGLLLLCEE
jgi:hypothetical protein